jgi:hypothetical protein
MALDENEVNKYLQPLFGQYEDSFQEAWVEILEHNPKTVNEIVPIARRVRNKAIKHYLEKKYKEESLQKPLRNDGDEKFTLESILASPANEDIGETPEGSNALYKKIVDFLIGEYSKQKAENIKLRQRNIQIKAKRLRLREESLKFKKDRFESWRKLMEEKGKQKENQNGLKIELQREKLKFQREREVVGEGKCTLGRTMTFLISEHAAAIYPACPSCRRECNEHRHYFR